MKNYKCKKLPILLMSCPIVTMLSKPTEISSFCFLFLKSIRVQESDGSFFESYTALCWKQENRRLQVLREDDISNHLTLKNSTDDITDPATYQEVGPNS